MVVKSTLGEEGVPVFEDVCKLLLHISWMFVDLVDVQYSLGSRDLLASKVDRSYGLHVYCFYGF